MTPETTTEDICANRHGGDLESASAHSHVDTTRDRETVYRLVRDSGRAGMTLDEIAAEIDRAPNCISGRITELKRDGRIVPSGQRRRTRTGCLAKVYVANVV